MDLSRDPITHTLYGDLKRMVQVSIEQECFVSALIILLTSIDVVAGLDRPADRDRNTIADFIRWADVYMTPRLPHRITGEELYSARCATLHQLGIESELTRAGRARRVGFMVGGNRPAVYDPTIDPTQILLRLDVLVDAFFQAVDAFLMAAFADSGKRRILEERLKKIIMKMSYHEDGTPAE